MTECSLLWLRQDLWLGDHPGWDEIYNLQDAGVAPAGCPLPLIGHEAARAWAMAAWEVVLAA